MARRAKSPMYIQIGENIKKYREEQDLTRDKLAEKLDLSSSYWAGFDSLLREEDAETIEIIRTMVIQQLKLIHK